MNKKLILGIIVLVIAGGVGGFFYFTKTANNDQGSVINDQRLTDGDLPEGIEVVEEGGEKKIIDNKNRFAISIKTSGGGKNGQLEAIVHGISRSLSKVDENYRSALKKNGFLTRDPRKKERRKVGTGGKARRAKQSPKR